MNNFRFDMTALGEINLRLAMRLAFWRGHEPSEGLQPCATHYMRWREKGLIFFSTDPKSIEPHGAPKATAFQAEVDADEAAYLAYRWLATVDYGEEPGHDGFNKKGWRLYNEEWGHVGGFWQAIIAVQPTWAWFGK